MTGLPVGSGTKKLGQELMMRPGSLPRKLDLEKSFADLTKKVSHLTSIDSVGPEYMR